MSDRRMPAAMPWVSGVLLAAIVLLAAFLRVYDITRTPPGLYPDEAMNGNNALEALRTSDFKVFYPENAGREGLMIALQAASLQLFGVREPWVLRVPSALMGVSTVLGLAWLGRELFSTRAGLIAAFLMATSTWHLYFSRMGFRVILAPLLAVWATAWLVGALRRQQADRPWMSWAVAAGVAFGLGFYSYIAFRVMPVVLLALLPWQRRVPGFWRCVGVFVGVTFVVALPLGWHFVTTPEDFLLRSNEVSVFAGERPISAFVSNVGETVGMLFWHGDDNWRHNFSGRAQLFWPVAGLFGAGCVVGLLAVWKKRTDGVVHGLLFVWIVLAMLPVAFTSQGIPHALRSLLMLPPVLLLAASGADVLARWLERRPLTSWAPAALAVIGAVALTAEAWTSYFVQYAPRPEVAVAFNQDYVDTARAIEALPDDVRKNVIVDASGRAVRENRMPSQTVMFLTDTFDPEMARRKNVYYIDPDDVDPTAPGVTFHIR